MTAGSTIETINRAIKPAVFIKERISDSWKLTYKDSILFLREAAKEQNAKARILSIQLAQKVSEK